MSSGSDPRHIAIIMDGNGRWARERSSHRSEGHKAGVRATQAVIEACARRGVGVLTLFAFSSENWRRPESEVSVLMELFLRTLRTEVGRLSDNDVRLRFVGERSGFGNALQREMARAEHRTAGNDGMELVIAANYGGRWDITQAARQLAAEAAAGRVDPATIEADQLAGRLSLADLPDPDLFIRTGGERRISNYLLWQLAYTELWFTETLWPDFDADALDAAIACYRGRQRRYGRTSEQVERVGRARTV
ncbi:MAG: polyprenyl diphosphate synthase [Halofilum sp. (in: g-proteobacteria)]|nr:polyprenyl diphosphate synthase [Halofilum sp. (in: g-proteobacteria)]